MAACTGKAQVNSLTIPTVSSDSKKNGVSIHRENILLLSVLGKLKKPTEKKKRFFYITYILKFHYTEKFLCFFATKK